MQRHALSLAEHGCDVDLIGFAGTPLPSAVRSHPRVRVRHLAAFEHSHTLPLLLLALLMLARQAELAFALAVRLLGLGRRRVILVQNPPALPAVVVALAVAPLLGARVIVDWHNLTSAMLRLRLEERPESRLSRLVTALAERTEHVARLATAHFAVSSELADRSGAPAVVVLRDQPPASFRTLSAEERRTVVTQRLGLAADVPLVICPTSWSTDEATELLLEVAAAWSESPLVLLLTGFGEQRARFESLIARLPTTGARVLTGWFEPDDFPFVLASADLGLCLHRSASGVDVPIKLAEMRGCGLPSAVLDYGPAVRESTVVGSLLFSSAADLVALLHRLFAKFPETPELDRLRRDLAAQPNARWEAEWDRTAAPVFERLLA